MKISIKNDKFKYVKIIQKTIEYKKRIEYMEIEINKIKLNLNNPRNINKDKFDKLVKSIKDFPEMLKIRPIVVDETMMVLGGNMRLKACKDAGFKEVHIIKADDLTEEQKKEFIKLLNNYRKNVKKFLN